MSGSSHSHLSSLALVERARQHDARAIAELYDRSRDRLRRALRRRLGSSFAQAQVDSEDAVHDGIVAALKKIDQFEYRGQGSFLAWLLRVTENELRMRVRAQHAERRDVRRERELDEAHGVATPDASPSQVAAGNEAEALLQRALARMPDRERDVIVLRRYMDMDATEIAEELALPSRGAARALLSRAQAKLAVLLESLGGTTS